MCPIMKYCIRLRFNHKSFKISLYEWGYNCVICCYIWCGRRDSNSQHSDSKSLRVGKQGQTATNKVNIINMIKGLIYLGIPSNMACFCKSMAQNWHKNLPHTDHKNGITELHLISGLIYTSVDT